jgi:hypothetical protein
MKHLLSVEEKTGRRRIFQDGKIYFSRSSERMFFLIMTAVMAVSGIISRLLT